MNYRIFENRMLGEKYYDATLDNGLRILLCPKNTSRVYASLGVGFGALDNGYYSGGKYYRLPVGTAHFLEHKTFANPGGRDASREFEELGENVNAYTSYEKTVFTFDCTTENFGECLSMLVNMISHPYYTKENVEKETAIIAQEIKNDLDDPYENCYRGLLGNMYPVGNLKNNICGSIKSLSDITPELLYECYKSFYTPNNTVLSVCGNVDIGQLVNSDLNKLNGRSFIKRSRILRIKSKMPDKVVKSDVPRSIFEIGVRCQPTQVSVCPEKYSDSFCRKRLYRDTLLSMTGSAVFPKSGRFFAGLLDNMLVSDISYGSAVFDRAAYCELSGETDDCDGVLSAYKKHIDYIAKNGVSSDEMRRAKRVMYADFISMFDSADDLSTQMLDAAFDGVGLFDYIDAINDIDGESVNKLILSEFTSDNTTVSLTLPR